MEPKVLLLKPTDMVKGHTDWTIRVRGSQRALWTAEYVFLEDVGVTRLIKNRWVLPKNKLHERFFLAQLKSMALGLEEFEKKYLGWR